MIDSMMRRLEELDPEVGTLVRAEFLRERNGLEMIASENVVSESVILAT